MNDTLLIAAIACACTGGVGLVGAGVLRLVPRQTLRLALSGVAVFTVVAMAAAMIAAERAMFLNPGDLNVALEIALVAGVGALAVALFLGGRVVRAGKALQEATRALGDAGRYDAPAHTATEEFAELSRELERTSARLAASREREQALEHSRRELVAWVSHDLRTPLAGLRAMAEALQDGMVDDPTRYHKQILVETERLSGMVDDLFELSRIHAGALRLSMRRVSLADLVADAVAGAEPLASARGVQVAGWAASPVPVEADGAEITRVFTNLVVNAIRHTGPGGSVEIAAVEDGGMGVVTVADRCGGIPPDNLDRVFDVGWRGDNARTPGQGRGGGLGLAIVRGIVEAHAGWVSVANTSVGCRFEVRLPGGRPAVARRGTPLPA